MSDYLVNKIKEAERRIEELKLLIKEWKKKKNYLKVGCPRCGEHLVYNNDKQKMACLNKECEHYKK